ncbi:MAG TPA: methionine gamma-lyase family protein, partial [Desulfobacteria bacterium]|nr:methionine gamma-lyase family protein [Desulfobacteria bacterium]
MLYPNYDINPNLLRTAEKVQEMIKPQLAALATVSAVNHAKVLQAFQAERISDYHFHGTTGYGLGDEGRDALERVAARIFKAEAALVRSQIVSGTHAIALCLFGALRPGDELLAATGAP